MKKRTHASRRQFLGSVALGGGLAAQQRRTSAQGARSSEAGYPRVFSGRQLAMLAFPLGGVGAGSISLGGRGQLRDWEIFNRAEKGNNLAYAFPSIWTETNDQQPIARVVEARYQPPYEGQDGLGSQNAPGVSRLASARFS